MHPPSLFSLFSLSSSSTNTELNKNGDKSVIPGWHLHSTQHLDKDLTAWSLPNANVSSWHRVPPRSTVLAGLIANNIYNESDLFYSDHLSTVNASLFQVPWLYREEFSLASSPTPHQHLFLITHGITSKADILLNGAQIASSDTQRGSYVGNTYEITAHARDGANALLIQAHPADYLRDLVVGFGDWNPHPPDNGMGVWRDVEVKLTGPLSLSPPRVTTNFTAQSEQPVVVEMTVKTDVVNHENVPIDALVQASIQPPDNSEPVDITQRLHLSPHQNLTATLVTTLSNPQVWWPAEWGAQPLYTLYLNVSDLSRPDELSDITGTRFGIRSVSSKLTAYNDTLFSINGYPFPVRGAGYSPDIFLRFDAQRVKSLFQYVLDMGLNTVRLEGKQEHPELYNLADEMGLLVMAGWECCDKWEAWDYNHDITAPKWNSKDYATAYTSMLHEATMMQPHPSLIGFLIGSDYWPNPRATTAYLSALNKSDWDTPVIAAASKRGYPSELGSSGLRMDGPYDWIPPVYWYTTDDGIMEGGAPTSGFGSELGSGVGTPSLSALKSFLSPGELEGLWTQPQGKGYHLSPKGTVFDNRGIYNTGLEGRYGSVRSVGEYVFWAQVMDYEATRAQFEAFAVRSGKNTGKEGRGATGMVYWMLNGAWPSLHWQLVDWRLGVSGAYYGVKTALRKEAVVLDYAAREVYTVRRGFGKGEKKNRKVRMDLVGSDGKVVLQKETEVEMENEAKSVMGVPEIGQLRDGEVAFLRLVLSDRGTGEMLSRNVYWLSREEDELGWDETTWYSTPVQTYANLTALSRLSTANVAATAPPIKATAIEVVLENQSEVPAFFLTLTVMDPATREEVTPVVWSDNYVTLLGHEKMSLTVQVPDKPWMITMSGGNIDERIIGRK